MRSLLYLLLATILVTALASPVRGHEGTVLQETVTSISRATGSFTIGSADGKTTTVIMQSSTTVLANGQTRIGRAALAGLEVGAQVVVEGNLVAETHLLAATIRVLSPAARRPALGATVVTGRVVARTAAGLTIASSTGLAMDAVLVSTARVTGQRASLAAIAVGDILRLHGTIEAGLLMVTQIEVMAKGDARSSSQGATSAGSAASSEAAGEAAINLAGVIQIRFP